MYFQVAGKMFVASGGTAYTQAVSMEGANAALAEFTNFAAGTATVTFEGGNDLENWGTVPDSSGTTVGPAYGTAKASAVATRYVRLRVVAATAGAILGAGINTSSQ